MAPTSSAPLCPVIPFHPAHARKEKKRLALSLPADSPREGRSMNPLRRPAAARREGPPGGDGSPPVDADPGIRGGGGSPYRPDGSLRLGGASAGGQGTPAHGVQAPWGRCAVAELPGGRPNCHPNCRGRRLGLRCGCRRAGHSGCLPGLVDQRSCAVAEQQRTELDAGRTTTALTSDRRRLKGVGPGARGRRRGVGRGANG